MAEFTLRQLEYFVAVAEHGTIAHAATALHVSESAVATAIGDLERSLGASLAIRRRAHGVTLTSEGRTVLAHARTVLREARELSASLGGDEISGPLAVGCYDTMAATILPRLVRGFTDAHPSVALTAMDGPGPVILQRLDDGDLDLAILYDRDIEGQPETAPLLELRAHVIVAADHWAASRESISFAELADEPFVRFDLNPSWQHTRSLMQAQGVTPRECYRTSNLEHARSMVGQGLGYSVLVQRPASDTTHDGRRIVRLELEPPVPPVRIVLAWRAATRPSPRVRAFIEHAVEAFATGGAGDVETA